MSATDQPRRQALLVAIGAALLGVALGALMGIVWWWVTPTETWMKTDGGLAPSQFSSSSWFAADGWFLMLGAVAGLVLTGLGWLKGRHHPVTLFLGTLVGAALLSLVAWSVGGWLGPSDPAESTESVAVGALVDGSLGLRAMGVLAAPIVSSLAMLALLLSTIGVRDDRRGEQPQTSPDVPDAGGAWVPRRPITEGPS